MLFLNGKTRSLYFQRKKAANLAWTTTYRRLHKKDQAGEQAKRKRRNLHSKKPRAIGNLTVEEIEKRRNERPDVRAKQRELAVREIKERMRKAKAGRSKAAAAQGKTAQGKASQGKGQAEQSRGGAGQGKGGAKK